MVNKNKTFCSILNKNANYNNKILKQNSKNKNLKNIKSKILKKSNLEKSLINITIKINWFVNIRNSDHNMVNWNDHNINSLLYFVYVINNNKLNLIRKYRY